MSHEEGPLTTKESKDSDKKTEGRGLKTSKDLAKVISRDLEAKPKTTEKPSRLSEWLHASKSKKEANNDQADIDDNPPLERLSQNEQSLIAESLRDQVQDFIEDEPVQVHEAVDSYYDKVISDHLEPVESKQAVLNEFGVEPDHIDQPSDDLDHLLQVEGHPVDNNETADTQRPGLYEMLYDQSHDKADEARFQDEQSETVNSQTEPKTNESINPDLPPPPPPPVRPIEFMSPDPEDPRNQAWSHASQSSANQATAPITVERSSHNQSNDSANSISSGLIGYLVGRRRGRIKTEKKLLPVQRKLEKQVKDFTEKLKFSESRVQKLTREKYRQPEKPLLSALKKEVIPAGNTKFSHLAPETAALRKPFAEEYLSAKINPVEARQIHNTNPTTERIGKLVVPATAEAVVASRIHKRIELTPNKDKDLVESRVQELKYKPEEAYKMSHRELMLTADKIIIEGSSLSQMYNKHLFGERGLRRLVQEYLKGKDIKKALRRELVEKQIDFERDPILRDRTNAEAALANSATSNSSDGSQDVLSGLITKASANLAGSSNSEPYFHSSEQSSNSSADGDIGNVAKDASILGTILLLVIAIVVIYLSRH